MNKVNPLTGQLESGGITLAKVLAAICPTGTRLHRFTTNSVLAGWVPAQGGTIGNAASGATVRANADTLALFTLIWEQTSNADLPIGGGPIIKGTDALSDFNIGATLTLPDFRGRACFDYDAGGATGRLTNAAGGIGTGGALGKSGGADVHALGILELPAHVHDYNNPGGVNNVMDGSGGDNVIQSNSPEVTGPVGENDPHNNMPPAIIGGITFLKL